VAASSRGRKQDVGQRLFGEAARHCVVFGARVMQCELSQCAAAVILPVAECSALTGTGVMGPDTSPPEHHTVQLGVMCMAGPSTHTCR
jgi:hypothetical protein